MKKYIDACDSLMLILFIYFNDANTRDKIIIIITVVGAAASFVIIIIITSVVGIVDIRFVFN